MQQSKSILVGIMMIAVLLATTQWMTGQPSAVPEQTSDFQLRREMREFVESNNRKWADMREREEVKWQDISQQVSRLEKQIGQLKSGFRLTTKVINSESNSIQLPTASRNGYLLSVWIEGEYYDYRVWYACAHRGYDLNGAPGPGYIRPFAVLNEYVNETNGGAREAWGARKLTIDGSGKLSITFGKWPPQNLTLHYAVIDPAIVFHQPVLGNQKGE